MTNYWRLLIVFSISFLGLLVIARLSNLLIFGDVDDLSLYLGSLPDLLFLGFRFDLKAVAVLLLVFYWLPIMTTGWWLRSEYFKVYLRWIFTCIILLLLILVFIEFGYRIFFGGPIDVLIFGFYEDDTLAVIKTIIADWRLLGFTLLFLAVTVLMCKSFWRYSHSNHVLGRSSRAQFLTIHLILLVVLLILGRGSLGPFPLRTSNASVGDNAFINSLVLNSVFNLQKALKERGESGINRSVKDLLKDAKVKDISELKNHAGFGLEPLIVTTPVKQNALPHVVFVLAEGWSTEIAVGQSEGNQVLGEFNKHLESDYFYRHFFSNAYGTNATVEALLLNSPISPLSQSAARDVSFAMSNVLPFKRSGYRTLFISGGDSSWRNHEKFWTLQGFDSYIGRAAIEEHFELKDSNNPWGVYEEYLFAYVEEQIIKAEADSKPLFVFVLTTNNHPPVDLPSSYVSPPLDPSVYGFTVDEEDKRRVLEGYHYQTDQLGKFISWIKEGFLKDKVIVTATGDHILKGFSDYNAIARAYLRYSVPAYFYVPKALDQLEDVPVSITGSHQDIFPTLFELALSESSYYQFGKPLMHKSPERAYAWIDQGAFLFNEGLADVNTKVLNPWADNQRVLLSPVANSLTEEQAKIIEVEKYRGLLKELLLLQDYETQ